MGSLPLAPRIPRSVHSFRRGKKRRRRHIPSRRRGAWRAAPAASLRLPEPIAAAARGRLRGEQRRVLRRETSVQRRRREHADGVKEPLAFASAAKTGSWPADELQSTSPDAPADAAKAAATRGRRTAAAAPCRNQGPAAPQAAPQAAASRQRNMAGKGVTPTRPRARQRRARRPGPRPAPRGERRHAHCGVRQGTGGGGVRQVRCCSSSSSVACWPRRAAVVRRIAVVACATRRPRPPTIYELRSNIPLAPPPQPMRQQLP